MPISANFYIQTSESVISPGPSADDLPGLILSNAKIAPIGSPIPYYSASQVAQDFGQNSDEAIAAKIYFGGFSESSKTPGTVYFTGFPKTGADVPAAIIGSSLGSNPSFTSIQQNKTANVSISLSGSEQKFSANIDLSQCKTFSDIAAQIQQDLNTSSSPSFTCEFFANRFIISCNSAQEGSISTISGSAFLGLSQDLAAASLPFAGSQETPTNGILSSIGEILDNVRKLNADFCAIGSACDVLAAANEIIAWCNSQTPLVIASIVDTSLNLAEIPSDETLLPPKTIDNLSQLSCWWTPFTGTGDGKGITRYSNLLLAFMAATDFTKTKGRYTLAYRTQPGLLANVSDNTTGTSLENGLYNFVAKNINLDIAKNWIWPGKVTGDFKWADSAIGNIWLTRKAQVTLLNWIQRTGAQNYTDRTSKNVRSLLQSVIDQAINFGLIVSGATISEESIQEISSQFGASAVKNIQSQGYYISCDMASVPAAEQDNRGFAPVYIIYTDGGAVQRINLSTILSK